MTLEGPGQPAATPPASLVIGEWIPTTGMGLDVELEGVSVHYGSMAAVDDVSLTVRAGEFFSLLGPSGCGKTTILRLISGFMDPTCGKIRIGGRDMAGIGAERRPTAMIFQNLALFPLMKVWENIAFGLKYRGIGRVERRRRAGELLEMISMADQGEKLVSELSGGQRQRVAIARALAVEPAVLLLDEPLSALDLKLRQHMRAELRSLQRQTGVTFIYITHDQGEALNMADRVGVMSAGRLEQVAEASRIYEEPATPFVATFVGETNAFAGRILAAEGEYAVIETRHGPLRGRNPGRLPSGQAAIAFVRPERCRLNGTAPEENRVPSQVVRVDYDGAYVNLMLRGQARDLVVNLRNDGGLPAFAPGQEVTMGFPADAAIILAEPARPLDAINVD